MQSARQNGIDKETDLKQTVAVSSSASSSAGATAAVSSSVSSSAGAAASSTSAKPLPTYVPPAAVSASSSAAAAASSTSAEPLPTYVQPTDEEDDLYEKFIKLAENYADVLIPYGKSANKARAKIILYLDVIEDTKKQLTEYFLTNAIKVREDISKHWKRQELETALRELEAKEAQYRAEMKKKKIFELDKFVNFMQRIIGDMELAFEYVPDIRLKNEMKRGFLSIYKQPLEQTKLVKSVKKMIDNFADEEIEEALEKYRKLKDERVTKEKERTASGRQLQEEAASQPSSAAELSSSAEPLRATSSSPRGVSNEGGELVRVASEMTVSPQSIVHQTSKSAKGLNSYGRKARGTTGGQDFERQPLVSGEYKPGPRGRFETTGSIATPSGAGVRASFYAYDSSTTGQSTPKKRISGVPTRISGTPTRSRHGSGSSDLVPVMAGLEEESEDEHTAGSPQRPRASSQNPPSRKIAVPSTGSARSLRSAPRQRGNMLLGSAEQSGSASTPGSPSGSRAGKVVGAVKKRLTFGRSSTLTLNMEKRASEMRAARVSEVYGSERSNNSDRQQSEEGGSLASSQSREPLRTESDSPPPRP